MTVGGVEMLIRILLRAIPLILVAAFTLAVQVVDGPGMRPRDPRVTAAGARLARAPQVLCLRAPPAAPLVPCPGTGLPGKTPAPD